MIQFEDKLRESAQRLATRDNQRLHVPDSPLAQKRSYWGWVASPAAAVAGIVLGMSMNLFLAGEPEVRIVENTDTVAIQPARMYVKRIVRHKFVLRSELQIEDPDRQAFLIAPLPETIRPKGMADASLLADILINKYVYHLPFYRQIQKYKELGVKISDSTMNDWYAATCEKLKLLYDILVREVLSRDYIQVDESTLPVIDNEKHRAVKGTATRSTSPSRTHPASG